MNYILNKFENNVEKDVLCYYFTLIKFGFRWEIIVSPNIKLCEST